MSKRINVEKEIDKYTRQTWAFDVFGADIVFVGYSESKRPKNSKTWKLSYYWSTYNQRQKPEHPPLTLEIKQLALDAFISELRVCTWEEKR